VSDCVTCLTCVGDGGEDTGLRAAMRYSSDCCKTTYISLEESGMTGLDSTRSVNAMTLSWSLWLSSVKVLTSMPW